MKIRRKLISLLLSALLLVEVTPLQAFATNEPDYAAPNTVNIEETDEEVDAEREISGEADEFRGPDEKHFLNTDGSYTAIKYAFPVHYQESSESGWKDIDNRMILTDADAAPGVERARQAGSKAFGPDTEEVFVPQSSPLDVVFAKNSGMPFITTLNSNGYSLSWRYDIETPDEEKEELNTSEGITVEQEDTGSEGIQYRAIRNVTGKLIYQDVAESIDLECIADSLWIKENIVIKTPDAANSFLVTYAVGSLTAEQISDKKIYLYDEGEEPVYTICAPYMTDAVMAESSDVTLEIVSSEEGELLVRLSADIEWMNEDERKYPVRIDPYVFQGITNPDQDATAIYNPHDETEAAGTLIVGNDFGTYEKTRTYMKFTTPTLSAGDVVVKSRLNVSEYEGQYGFDPVGISSMKINAYKVTSSWTGYSVRNSTYYNNLPSKSTIVTDYQSVSSSTCGNWVTFDITRIAKEWYENADTNCGICLEAADPDDWSLARFVAADNTFYPTRRPTLEVTYLNSRGLEDRWTTHEQSMGRSGSSYLNDYTGNLVFTSSLVSTTGNRMPVELSLIYNGLQHGKTVDRVCKTGKGWRLSIQEKVIPLTSSSTGINGILYSLGYRYIYEDGDGTQHYFKLKEGSSSDCEDEEGMGLTLIVNSTVTDLEKYVIQSDKGGKMTFTEYGNLRKIYDSDGNFCKILFMDDGRISGITDGAGRTITFTYSTESGNTDRLVSVKDPADRVTSLSYTEYGSLYAITYPDGKTTRFSYDNSYRMIQARGTDGCRLIYSYGNSGGEAVKNRVISITEYDETGQTSGGSISMDYGSMNRTVFTDNKGRSETYQFDNYGRTTGIIDAAGNGSVYKYVSGNEENRKTANALKSVSTGQKYVNNMLRNHSFERSAYWDLSSGTQYSTESHYLGEKSLRLSGSEAYATQTVSIAEGYNYYAFSAYVKTDSASTGATVSIKYLDEDGDPIYVDGQMAIVFSNPINYETDWQRMSVSSKIPVGTAKIRVRCMTSGSGNAWFDCAQLETGTSVNEYNLVENGSFNDSAVSVWSMQNASGNDGLKWYGNDGYYKFYGQSSVEKRVIQSIPINKVGNRTFLTVSAKAKGESVPLTGDRRFSVGILAHYTDGSTGTVRWAKFNPDYASGWQSITNTVGFDTSATISYIEVFCSYGKNANAASFDNIQVNLDETGVTYTYDDKGNLISAKDNAKRNRAYTYSNANEMTGTTTEDNKHYTFTYDTTNKHRLIKATSATDSEQTTPRVEFSFGYDSYGNVTSSKVKNSSGKYIQQYINYTSNGNYLSTVYNDRGYGTQYDFNTLRGTLWNVTDPDGRNTYYTYESGNNRLKTISDSSDSTLSSATTVRYTYSDKDRLNEITSPSTEYEFTYDSFGNLKKTKAGDYTIAENTYESNNGNLTDVTYGNGFNISYGYDNLDRVTSRSYNGSRKYEWSYNAGNNVGRHWDLVNGKNYTYTYDILGRPLRMDVSDGSWIQSEYNTVDRPVKLRYYYNGVLRTVYQGYTGADNLPSTVSFASIGKVTDGYDSLTRLWQKGYKTNEGDSGVKAEYSYINWSSPDNQDRSTGVVRGIDYTYESGGLTVPDLYYNYDHAGNITEERLWSPSNNNPLREKYTYDSKNQLIRHDSATGNASYTFSYDKAGNITEKKRHAYTTGTLGTVIETDTYTYSTGSWKDLLTGYDGSSITYDGMGNMTSYGGRDYSWEGRELRQVLEGTSIYAYKYNADGIRTSKTVNGTATEYFLNGTQILAQKTGSDIMWFFYDSRGNRAGLLSNDTVYYYIYDLQGDVIALARASTGEIVAGYSYDAWGNCTVTNAAGYTIGNRNPFRYRGYYYDNETGLYYLNSRYYSPEFGRFISADVYISTGQGLQGINMFAYCGNDPIMYCDPNGDFSLCTMLNGATLLMIGVTACAVAAAAVIGGACVPLLIAATATFAAGGMTVLNGVAEVGESISGYNYMRDGLYNGNTEVYEAQRDIYATAADVGMTVVSTGIATGGICFVSGTLVQTEDGARPIEEIEQGDLVWSWNEETCETELKAVTEKYVSETSELIHIHVNGDEIVTTPGHPFYSPVLGWTDAIKLRAGDMLVLVNGEYVIVEKVQHEILESPVKVYNLNVKDCHTYYVTDDGVLVHNSCNHGYQWTSERRRFWKEQSKTAILGRDYGSYIATEENMARMARGLAPKGWDGASVQLHHWRGIANDFYDYSPLSGTLHRLIHTTK